MDPSTLPTIKILVVDDHPSTAQTLARAISQIGPRVEVSSATSGLQALEYTKDSPLDILITDMIMPEMTGLELIEQLQKRPVGRPTFSFLITAYEVPGLQVSARRLKVRDIINKPVHPERICQIISKSIQEMDSARPSSDTFPNKALTILIADDQPDNLMLLSRYLDREGYGYIKASDGLETLEMVRTHLPDLVLLDINMPHKDGFEVLGEIRADPITEHIPVIILTAARLDPAEIQSGLNMGADDYVTKPFDHKELLARIHTKLRVKQAEDMIRRQNRELKLLPEIGKELSARLNIEEIASILLKRTGETLGAMLGHMVILNPNGSYQKTHYCDDSSSSRQTPFSLPKKVLLEIANDSRQGFIIDDTRNDPYWGSVDNDSARSVVVVPMFGRHHLLGVLLLGNEQIGYFKLEHLLLLQAICSQASIAIENAQLNETMAQERQHLAAVLQNAADAILMFDAENRLSMVNPAGQKLFTDYEMRIGRQLAAGMGYDALLQSLQHAQQSGSSLAGEIEWPDKRIFSAAITSIKEGGCVVVLHDVSRFKELEKVKDEFIATASHDLRNPITSINGFSHLMKQAGPLTDMQGDFLTRIQDAAVQMSQLVENMLNLAKMDLGQELKHETVDLSQLLTKVTDEFKPHAQAKGQTLTLEQAAASQVRGDELQLLQALRNLVGNAVKYTPDNGAITIGMEQRDGKSLIKVCDNGYGIPATSLPFIFNRFYRVRNNGHSEIEGNGLGLAIVKSIIGQHDGEVTVESEPGVGSCFTVSLPSLVMVDIPQPQRISSTKYNKLERGSK